MITDDFSGTLGNWAQWNPAWGNCSITTAALRFPGGQDCGIRWTAAGAPGADQYSQIGVVNATWIDEYIGPGVRVTGADTTRSGYFLRLFDNDSTNKTLALVKYVNGTPTTLQTTTYATGTTPTLRIEAEGTSSTVLRCYVGGTQVTALNHTDSSTPLTTGVPGVLGQGTTISGDNFEGGDLAPAATLEQEGFRFGADDGSESTHTWLAAQDANINRSLNTPTLVTFIVNATGAPGAKTFKLQHKKVGDATCAVSGRSTRSPEPALRCARSACLTPPPPRSLSRWSASLPPAHRARA